VHSDVRARDYFLSDQLQDLKLDAIRASIEYLNTHYDLIIAEGAGSCAEPILRHLDVVNMGLAHLLAAKVYVVVDINKGARSPTSSAPWRSCALRNRATFSV
jgi:adenosylcobyric acid synthase